MMLKFGTLRAGKRSSDWLRVWRYKGALWVTVLGEAPQCPRVLKEMPRSTGCLHSHLHAVSEALGSDEI